MRNSESRRKLSSIRYFEENRSFVHLLLALQLTPYSRALLLSQSYQANFHFLITALQESEVHSLVQMKNLSDHLRGTTVLGQEPPTPDNSEEDESEAPFPCLYPQ